MRSLRVSLVILVALALLVTLVGCGKKKPRKPIKLDQHYAILPLDLEGEKPEISIEHELDIDEERIRLTKEYFRIHNSELHRYLPREDNETSIHFQPQIVVVHYTAIPTLQETLEYFEPTIIDGAREQVAQNGRLNVGVQFIVDRDGTIYRSYPENVMARHVIGLNHVAIGIENVGTADLGAAESGDAVPLTREQLQANAQLIRYLGRTYATLRYVIGHSEYRELENRKHPANHLFHEDVPGYRTEKDDPGDRFMAELRAALGMVPKR